MKLTSNIRFLLNEFKKYIKGKEGAETIIPLMDVLLDENQSYAFAWRTVQTVKELSEKTEGSCQVMAQTLMGFCYQYGLTTDQDTAKALKLYQQGVEKSFAVTEYQLSSCLNQIVTSGGRGDTKLASELYNKAKLQGYAPNKMKDLRSLSKALEAFKAQVTKFSKEKDSDGIIPLINILLDEKQNYAAVCEAVQKVKALSEKEGTHKDAAKTLLGFCYHYGIHVEVDCVMAVKLYEEAAVKEFSVAQRYLSYCLSAAIGVKKDVERAGILRDKAQKQGFYGEPDKNFTSYSQQRREDDGIAEIFRKQSCFRVSNPESRNPDLNLVDEKSRLDIVIDAIMREDSELIVSIYEMSDRHTIDLEDDERDFVKIFENCIKNKNGEQFKTLLNHFSNTLLKVFKGYISKAELEEPDCIDEGEALPSDEAVKKGTVNRFLVSGQGILHLCARHNFLEGARILSQMAVPLHSEGRDESPLHLAAKARHLEMVLLLLDPTVKMLVAKSEKSKTIKKPDSKEASEKAKSVDLSGADSKESEEEKKKREDRELLSRKYDEEEREQENKTVLIHALQALLPILDLREERREAGIEEPDKCLERKEELDLKGNDESVKISDLKLRKEIVSCIFELLKIIKDPNLDGYRARFGKPNPLHLAALTGCAEVVEYLINASKERDNLVDSKRSKHVPTLYEYEVIISHALKSKNPNSLKILNLLIDNLNVKMNDVVSFVVFSEKAIRQKNGEKLEILCKAMLVLQNQLKAGDKVEAQKIPDSVVQQYLGELLCLASNLGFEKGVQILLDAGVDPIIAHYISRYDVTIDKKITPLEAALKGGHIQVAKMIFQKYSPEEQYKFFLNASKSDCQFALENMKEESFKVKTVKDPHFITRGFSYTLQWDHPLGLKFLDEVHPDEPLIGLTGYPIPLSPLAYAYHHKNNGKNACLLGLLKRGADPFQPVESQYEAVKNVFDTRRSFFVEAASMGFVEGIRCIIEKHSGSPRFREEANHAFKVALKYGNFLIASLLLEALRKLKDDKCLATLKKAMPKDFDQNAPESSKKLLKQIKDGNFREINTAMGLCTADFVKKSEILFMLQTMIDKGAHEEDFPEVSKLQEIFPEYFPKEPDSDRKTNADNYHSVQVDEPSASGFSLSRRPKKSGYSDLDRTDIGTPLLSEKREPAEDENLKSNTCKKLILQYFREVYRERQQAQDEKTQREIVDTKLLADKSVANQSAGLSLSSTTSSSSNVSDNSNNSNSHSAGSTLSSSSSATQAISVSTPSLGLQFSLVGDEFNAVLMKAQSMTLSANSQTMTIDLSQPRVSGGTLQPTEPQAMTVAFATLSSAVSVAAVTTEASASSLKKQQQKQVVVI